MVFTFGYVLNFILVSWISIRVEEGAYVRAFTHPMVVCMAVLHLIICLSHLLFGCFRSTRVYMGMRSVGSCRVLSLFLEVSQ